MIDADLTQFLIDITRGQWRDAWSADPDSVVANSGLRERLQQAVRQQDIATLWQAGAHPMALLYFSRACGWSMPKYYECISAARSPADPGHPAPDAPYEQARTHRSSARHGS